MYTGQFCGDCVDGLLGSGAYDAIQYYNYPYTYAAGNFTIDLLGAIDPDRVMGYINPATGLKTTRDRFLQPGAIVSLYNFNSDPSTAMVSPPTLPTLHVVSRGSIDATTGNLTSVTIGPNPLPTNGNVYPGSNIIDCVTPDTSGLVVGSTVTGVGIASGSTIEVIDFKSIWISNPATVTASIYEALTFTLPVAIPSTGYCDVSNCMTFETDLPFRTAGTTPNDHFYPSTAYSTDITQNYSSLTLSCTVDQSVTTAGSQTKTDGSTLDYSSTLSLTGTAAFGLTAAPVQSPIISGSGLPISPANPGILDPGTFRVFRAGGCCSNCFYILIYNPPWSTSSFSDYGSGTTAGSYSSTATYPSGSTVTTTQDLSGTFGMTVTATYQDQGFYCNNAYGQDSSNPETLFGVWDASYALEGGTETGDYSIVTSSPPPGYGPASVTGSNMLGGLPGALSAGTRVNSCDFAGSFSFNASGTTEVDSTCASGVLTTTTIKTPYGGSPATSSIETGTCSSTILSSTTSVITSNLDSITISLS